MRRRFGYIRQLNSGRWQVYFRAPNGKRQTAGQTFRTKSDASRWLVKVEADILSGAWQRNTAEPVPFRDYAVTWLDANPRVGPRWRETCERNLRLHLVALHDVPVPALTTGTVRAWYAAAMAGTGGRTSIRQAYRFLRAVLNTAVDDGLLKTNPCKIAGAGSDRAKQRPVATPAQVAALAATVRERYRAAILLAAWCGLRRGEILALHRDDLDLKNGVVSVSRTQVELLNGHRRFEAAPKTDSSYRAVAVPPHIVPDLQTHLDHYAGETLLFVAPDGRRLRGDTLYHAFVRARNAIGMDDLRFHDLRHTGQTLAAATGATMPDLMRRLGHASQAAANRYLHAVSGRDAAIAAELSQLAEHGDLARLPRKVTTK